MSAAASRVESRVTNEDRIARIESDVAEIKDDVKAVNIRLNESIAANAREFGALRTELEKNVGAVRTELAEHRAETEKSFGAVRVEIEKTRTEIVSAKLWMLLITIGTLASLLMSILRFFGHTS